MDFQRRKLRAFRYSLDPLPTSRFQLVLPFLVVVTFLGVAVSYTGIRACPRLVSISMANLGRRMRPRMRTGEPLYRLVFSLVGMLALV